MTAGARLDIKSATLFRQLNMLVDELGEPLAPIGGDVEILQEGEFLLGLFRHEAKLTTEDTEEDKEKLTIISDWYSSSRCPLWLDHPRNRLYLSTSQANMTSRLSPRRRCERNDIPCRTQDVSLAESRRSANATAPVLAKFPPRPYGPRNTPARLRSTSARAPDR